MNGEIILTDGPNGRPIGPRDDSKPTQPKDPGEMSRDEEDELFDATLERDDVAEMIWEAVIDEISKEQAKEIINVLFRKDGTRMGDFMEAGRLIHRATCKRVHKIVDDESSSTDMGND